MSIPGAGPQQTTSSAIVTGSPQLQRQPAGPQGLGVLEKARRIWRLEGFASATVAAGNLNKSGVASVLQLQQSLGLTPRDSWFGAWRVSVRAIALVRRTNRMSPEQEWALEQLIAIFGGSAERLRRTRDELGPALILYQVERNNLPVISVPGLMLQGGERVHWSEAGSITEVRVIGRRYVGGSSGMSFRIAKGVSYRVGGYRGHSVSERGIVPVSRGALILTDQRILFNGDGKTFMAKWRDILGFQFFKDGAQISFKTRSQPVTVRYASGRFAEVVAAIAQVLASRP